VIVVLDVTLCLMTALTMTPHSDSCDSVNSECDNAEIDCDNYNACTTNLCDEDTGLCLLRGTL